VCDQISAQLSNNCRMIARVKLLGFGHRAEEACHLSVSLFASLLGESQIAGVGIAFAVECSLEVLKCVCRIGDETPAVEYGSR